MRSHRRPTAPEAFTDADTAARYLAAYDALLASWPVACQTVQVATRLGITHVIISGPANAPPLVLLHGLRATALVWKSNVADLSRHFCVYAVDVIGQNGKSVASRRIKTRSDYALWLCELFDALGISQAALAGNSYGGFLALNQASLTPARVSRVVLINPAGIFVSVLPLVARVAWHSLLQTLHLRPQRLSTDVAQWLGRKVQLGADDRRWADMVGIISAKGTMRPNVIVPVVFSTRELRAIHTPTLLLMGDNELLYHPQDTLRIAMQRMPSLQIHLLPGAHHIAAMAKPAETNTQIIRFLGRGTLGSPAECDRGCSEAP